MKKLIITPQTKITPLTPPSQPKKKSIFVLSVRDPYRTLFLLGFLHLIFALLPWLHAAITKTSYPHSLHLHYAGIGYFTSLILGFTLTAIPRLTATPFIDRIQWATLVGLNLIALVGGFFSLPLYRAFFALALFIGTILVSQRLFSKKISNLAFLFLPIGMAIGVVGIILFEEPIGKILFTQFFLLLLTMGTGAYLLSILLGINPRNPFTKEQFLLLIALITASFWLGPWLRALAALLFGIFQLNIYKFVKRDARQAKGLWLSYWNIILGFVVYAIWPNAHTHHWLLICGFLLLTYLMSLRVIFAHGGHSISIEKSGKSIYWVVGLIIMAGATRATAHLMPSSYLNHLGYASLTLLAALVIWLSTSLSKFFKVGPNGEH